MMVTRIFYTILGFFNRPHAQKCTTYENVQIRGSLSHDMDRVFCPGLSTSFVISTYLDLASLAQWRATSSSGFQDTEQHAFPSTWRNYVTKESPHKACVLCPCVRLKWKGDDCPLCDQWVCEKHLEMCPDCANVCCSNCVWFCCR